MYFDYKLFKKALIAFGVLAPIALILRLFTYWKELEITTGFFSGNGAGCFIFNLIGFAVFFLCLLLTYRKGGSFVGESSVSLSVPETEEDDLLRQEEDELFDEVEEDYPDYFLHGFAKKCTVWFGTFSAFAALLPGFGLLSHGLSFLVEKESLSDTYAMIYAVITLLSGGFFLLYAFRNSAERSRFFAFFALIPAFWGTLRMIIEYRDLTRFLNKSLYVGQFLFVISALVFFLYQAEILLGEEKISRPNAYAFSGLSMVFFGLTARFPQLIAMMGERIQFDLYTSTALLADLALTAFAVSKLVAITKRR